MYCTLLHCVVLCIENEHTVAEPSGEARQYGFQAIEAVDGEDVTADRGAGDRVQLELRDPPANTNGDQVDASLAGVHSVLPRVVGVVRFSVRDDHPHIGNRASVTLVFSEYVLTQIPIGRTILFKGVPR